ncbi:MAG: HAD hydrolase-like protein [Bdellovibrionota bacterium]
MLEVEKIRPENSVMIGDRLHDIRGGKLNGLATVGVTGGYGSRSELVEAGADHIVDTVTELESLLASV